MSRLVIAEHGKFKLEKSDGGGYMILNGVRIDKQYASITWAKKRYERLTQIFSKE